MGQNRKQPPSDDSPGAPLWMVTFSDCMNLLLTFFVLITTFSCYDTKVLSDMGTTFRQIFSVGNEGIAKTSKEAVIPKSLVTPVQYYDKGSESPTLTRGPENNLKKEYPPADLSSGKTFLIPSADIFLGKGQALSASGKNFLETMASFLKEIPCRIVVSEISPDNENNEPAGMQRALAIMEYLTANQGLDSQRFSISQAGLLPKGSIVNIIKSSEPTCVLGITLLEWSLYN
jgi:chemotaxis protein MotB